MWSAKSKVQNINKIISNKLVLRVVFGIEDNAWNLVKIVFVLIEAKTGIYD